MKILYVGFVLFFSWVSIITNAQTPNWQWAETLAGGIDVDGVGNSIGTDVYGNIYVAGTSGPLIAFGNDTLNDPGPNIGVNMFLVKYDPSGNVLWTKNATGDDEVGGMCVDRNGNIYVAGFFDSLSITFGDITLTGGDSFVVKYDSSGNVKWAKSIGGGASAISEDRNGNVYLFGNFNNSSITFGNTTLPGEGLFLVKCDALGNVVWAKGAKGIAGEGNNSISTDVNSNIYITGYFQAPFLVFGTDTLGKTVDSTYNNIFVVKYDSSGDLIWTKDISTSQANTSINTDVAGNSYLAGWIEGIGVIFGNDTLTSDGLFITKYNAQGNVLWAKAGEGTKNAGVRGVTTDTDGNAYLTGWSTTPVVFAGNDTLTGNGLLVIKYDSLGNFIWAKFDSATQYAEGHAISADNFGNIYVTGVFGGFDAVFGKDTLSGQQLPDGVYNFFVAKLANSDGTDVKSLFNSFVPIAIYPNPTSGTIYFKGVQAGQTLQVYNLLGEEISSSIINQDNYNINLGGKAKGMYFYRVTTSNSLVQQGKIVVE